MELVHILLITAAAIIAGFVLNFVLVRAFDPRGTEALARRRARELEQDARSDTQQAFIRQLGEKISRLLPMTRSSENALAMRLSRAGIKTSVETYWGVVVASALVSVALGVALAIVINASVLARLALVLVFLAFGLVIPRLYVNIRARKRQEEIEASLPATLELLSVVVEAGQTIERGIKEVAERTEGPLAEEFKIVNLDIMRYHKKTSVALSELARRCNLKSVGLFCTAVSQALEQGSAIGRILKTQASIASENYYMAVEERSNKIAVKMSIATIFFLLPPVLVVSIGPAIINFISNGSSAFGM